MKTVIEVLVIFVSVCLCLWGGALSQDADFDPVWRKVIGGLMVIGGLELFRHGLNYIQSIP